MTTKYEEQMYHDIHRIANALERISKWNTQMDLDREALAMVSMGFYSDKFTEARNQLFEIIRTLEVLGNYTKLTVHHNIIDKTDVYFINGIECPIDEYGVVDKWLSHHNEK